MIGPLPRGYAATREALHRLAVYVVSPARRLVNGEITLVATPGGFGTPPFGDPARRVRVDGADIVVELGEVEARQPVTSLAAAAALAGIAPDVGQEELFDVPLHGDLDAPLGVDPAAVAAFAGWCAFAFDVLGEVRREARPEDVAGDVLMWPEHFDVAVEMGSEAAGLRGTYGASPGDAASAEPYLYVTVWAGPPDDAFWNAEGFRGAWRRHGELLASGDPRAAALAFFRSARRRVLGY
ncbi:MAG: hypothetical protein AB1416_07380 [Actinomycetota bacterium]